MDENIDANEGWGLGEPRKTSSPDEGEWGLGAPKKATPRVETQPISTIARYNKSAGNAEEPELTWEETGKGALQQLLPSSGRLIKETAKALTVNLPETAEGIGQIISGLSSKVGGNFGLEQSPEEKQKKEALVDALGRHYAETYGSIEGFKKAFAKDPASILSDLTLPVSGIGGISAKIAKAGNLAKTAKALSLTSKASQYLDPVQAALGVAGKVAKLPVVALRGLSSARSGVAYSSLTDVYNLAKQGNQVQREAFNLGRKGTESVVFEKVHNSFDTAAQEASDAYVNNMGNLAKEPANWGSILNKIDEEINKIEKFNPKTGNKFIASGNENTLKELKTAREDVVNYQDAAGNIAEADAYKRSLYNIVYGRSSGDKAAKDALGRIAKETRDSIEKIDSNYAEIMDQWQDWLNLSNELKSAGAAGSRAGDTAALEKLMKALKKPAKRENTIDVLTEYDEGIPYLLAGYATKPALRGSPNLTDIALGTMGYFAHPAAAAGALYGMSPRLGSMTQTALGTLDKYGSALTSKPIVYTAEKLRPGEEAQASAEASNAQPNAEPESASSSTGRPSWMDNLISTPTVGAETPGAIGRPIGSSEPYNYNSATIDQAKNAIANVESRGSGGYNAVGPNVGGGNVALGKYQVMASNVPQWTKKYLGYEITPQQFLNDAKAQELVFEGAFGDALKRYGNMKDAVSWWHSGKPLSKAQNKKDVLGTTTPDYVKRVISGMPSASGGRIERASGGRAVNHADMAEKLVRQAERVKKVQGQGTEALLDHQDDAIISALEIANRHI